MVFYIKSCRKIWQDGNYYFVSINSTSQIIDDILHGCFSSLVGTIAPKGTILICHHYSDNYLDGLTMMKFPAHRDERRPCNCWGQRWLHFLNRGCAIAVLKASGKISNSRAQFIIQVVKWGRQCEQTLKSLVRLGSRAQEDDFILLMAALTLSSPIILKDIIPDGGLWTGGAQWLAQQSYANWVTWGGGQELLVHLADTVVGTWIQIRFLS